MRRHPDLSGTVLKPIGYPSAWGAAAPDADLDAGAWCSQLAPGRHCCHGKAFQPGGNTDLDAADRLGWSKRRLRGVGISPLPLFGEPNIWADGRAGMARPRPVSAMQRSNHLAGNSPGPALVQPRSRLVGGHGLCHRTLGVYYGRAFQAEALLVLCAAGALEAHSIWMKQRAAWALALSWLCITGAALVKVIPLLWLGLPLILVQLTPSPKAVAESSQHMLQRLWRLLLNPWFWVYTATTLAVTSAWYLHSYQLGESSGLTFGFWGEDSDRSNIALVLSLSSWMNLGIRTGVRALVVVGIPFLVIGSIQSWRFGGGASHLAE